MKPLSQLTQITPQEIIDFLKKVDKKVWIRIGIISFFVLLFLVLIVIPAWFERPKVQNEIKSLEGQILYTQTLFLKKPLLLKNQAEYSRIISDAKARLYEPGGSSLLLGAISKLAIESKVSVVASMPKDVPAKFPAPYDKAYEGNTYDFTVEGSYHSLGKFVSQIESNEKLLRVETFAVKSRSETPGIHLASLSLSAVSTKKTTT